MDIELHLPDESEQERLLDGLSVVIRRAGFEHCVTAPIVLPENRFFPDAFSRDERGVSRLVKRLMRYAGIGDLALEIELYDEEAIAFDSEGIGSAHQGSAAWFAGIENRVCWFGVNQRELRDPDALVGSLAHEVSHAFRAERGLMVESRDVEEELTDLTCVYLGFGALTLNAAFLFKTGGLDERGRQMLYQKHTGGYLSPAQLALLFGAIVVARSTDKKQCRAIESHLQPNQAALFRKAVTLFDRDPKALRKRLGLPAPSEWPEPVSLQSLDSAPEDEREDDRVADPWHAPAAAIRVRHDRAIAFAALGVVAAVIASVSADSLIWMLPLIPLGGFATWRIGRSFVWHTCSACGAVVTRHMTECVCGSALQSDEPPRRDGSAPRDPGSHSSVA